MSPDNSRAWKAAMVDGLIDRMTRRVEGIVSVACDRELGDETDLHVCAHADAWSTTISVRVFTRQELNEGDVSALSSEILGSMHVALMRLPDDFCGRVAFRFGRIHGSGSYGNLIHDLDLPGARDAAWAVDARTDDPDPDDEFDLDSHVIQGVGLPHVSTRTLGLLAEFLERNAHCFAGDSIVMDDGAFEPCDLADNELVSLGHLLAVSGREQVRQALDLMQLGCWLQSFGATHHLCDKCGYPPTQLDGEAVLTAVEYLRSLRDQFHDQFGGRAVPIPLGKQDAPDREPT